MSVRFFPRSPRVCWLGLIGLAVLLRLGVMLAFPERLTEDRDLYLGIAGEMRSGHGFATPGSDPPRATAFRPPLYPLMLVLTGGSPLGIGALHLLLGGVMVMATGLAAERLAVRSGEVDWSMRLLAGGIVALDPMLLLYSGQPMTETLCSCLTAVLLWRLAQGQGNCHAAGTSSPPSLAIFTGLLWGLCLLARPTYAVAFGLWLVGSVVIPHCQLGSVRPRLRFGIVAGIVALAVLSPWAIRNWMMFGRPIVTTTHGGYTLWLANNPVYYSEVIEGHEPVWSGESLDRWQTETARDMDRLHLQGEVAQDRWQSQQAREFISANPWRFARACLHRALTFWSLWPGRAAESNVPGTVLGLIAGGYAALWLGVLVAILRAIRLGRGSLLFPAGSLILGFAAVHLVYWTDARMRAPVMPAVAIVVAVGFKRQGDGETITGTSSQINHSPSIHVSSSHPTSLSAPQ